MFREDLERVGFLGWWVMSRTDHPAPISPSPPVCLSYAWPLIHAIPPVSLCRWVGYLFNNEQRPDTAATNGSDLYRFWLLPSFLLACHWIGAEIATVDEEVRRNPTGPRKKGREKGREKERGSRGRGREWQGERNEADEFWPIVPDDNSSCTRYPGAEILEASRANSILRQERSFGWSSIRAR